jgi:glycogen(starch) synthase
MRVLYCSELFWPHIGGAEVLATKFLPAMQQRGFEFAVVTSHSAIDLPDETSFSGIPVYRFPFHRPLANRDVKGLMAVRERLALKKRTFKPDLVHINSVGADLFYHLHTRDAHPSRMLMTIHGLPLIDISEQHSQLVRALRSADWVTAVSEATLAKVVELAPEVASRSSVIYNGLEVPREPPAPLPFEAPRLLCLGRLVRHKGFDLALSAFASLVTRFPQSRLWVVGDGEVRSDLERQAVDLGVTRAVEFTGWVPPDQVPHLINRATVVVMPSRREPFGLVALQAAQMARPIVAARADGLTEVVVHRETGLLVEKDDSHALAEAIAFLLEHPGLAARMGRAARRRVEDLFSWDRFLDSYVGLYRNLVGRGA